MTTVEERLDNIESWLRDSGNPMATMLINPADPTSTLVTRFEAQGSKLDEVSQMLHHYFRTLEKRLKTESNKFRMLHKKSQQR